MKVWYQKKVEQDEGKPSRNVYSITQKGKRELIEWLKQPTENTPARLELLLKMTFAKNYPKEYMLKELEQVKQKHIKRLEEYLKIEKALSNDEKTKADYGYPYWLSTLRYGIGDAQFRIKWCEESIERIKG